MPIRFVPFTNGEYYHVFNRGVNKRKIFLSSEDYQRAIETLEYYSFSGHRLRFSYYLRLSDKLKFEYFSGLTTQLVDIIAFVLMPNHFHLLLSQNEEGGISTYLRLLENSYTKYFNTKYKRIGPLLQGAFKAVHISNDSQLLHVSRYIHLNPFSSKIVDTIDELEKYTWSSYPKYLLSNTSIGFLKNNIVMDQFQNQSYKYQQFVNEHSLYQRELEEIKHLILE